MSNFYEFQAKSINGEMIPMNQFKNKVVLVVNVASKCGFTPQYTDLEALHKEYNGKGLEILGFPCNQFGAQEPGTDKEIVQFCGTTYPVTFKMFSKIDVNGPNALPLYKFLCTSAKTDAHKTSHNPTSPEPMEPVKWNFTKFLIDREGNVVTRFSSQTSPKDLKPFIENLLKNT